jgi:Zn-dependent protease with chaperone function
MPYILSARGVGIEGEIYADQTALELTADPDAFIQAMRSLGELTATNTPKLEQDVQLFSNLLNTIKNNTNALRIDLLQKALDQGISEFKNDPKHPPIADRIAMAEKWKVDHAAATQASNQNTKE